MPILISATDVLIFFFQAEDGIRDSSVTGVQTCALPISGGIYPTTKLSMWFHLLPYVEAEYAYKSADPEVQQGSVVPAYNAPSDPYNLKPAGALNFAANMRVFAYKTYTPAAANAVGKVAP